MNDVRARRERLGIGQQGLADWASVKLRAVVNLELQPPAAAGQAGPGHSPSGDKIVAALDELEDNPELLKRLEGDHERTWMTLP